MSSFPRRLWRLSLLLVLAGGGFLVELLLFPLIAGHSRRRIIRRWSRALLTTCGLRLQVELPGIDGGIGRGTEEGVDRGIGRPGGPGAAPVLEQLARGRMLVANHTSWLDIFVINALATSAFVAKAELRRWPLAGWLVAMAGTVFIERARRHAVHQVIQALRDRIRSGIPVAVFPEATTSAGIPLLPFHANLLQAAISENAEVLPLAISYRDAAGEPAPEAAYIGDTTFLQSLWQVLGARDLVACIVVLDAVPAQGRNRHDLARELRERVSAALVLPMQDTPPGTAAAFPAASR